MPFAVGIAVGLILAACFAMVVGWNVGHAPVTAGTSGSVYSEWSLLLLFPYGEFAYAVSALTRAWVGLFLGAATGDLLASALVSAIALPIGFFYAALVCAGSLGAFRIVKLAAGNKDGRSR